MNDRTNNFKYLINKYQIGMGLVENINITVINSVFTVCFLLSQNYLPLPEQVQELVQLP